MKKLQMSFFPKSLLIAVASLALSATSSFGITIFSDSVGIQPSNVGKITLTQVDATHVKVLLDLVSSPLQYGLLNTGNADKKSAFSFTLSGSDAGVTATFSQPNPNNLFSLELAGSQNTPRGLFGASIELLGGNGTSAAYFGDLEFTLFRSTGLLESHFIANSDGYVFAADLTDGSNTGVQGWKTGTSTTSVPDSGTTLALMGMAVGSLGLIRRKMK